MTTDQWVLFVPLFILLVIGMIKGFAYMVQIEKMHHNELRTHHDELRKKLQSHLDDWVGYMIQGNFQYAEDALEDATHAVKRSSVHHVVRNQYYYDLNYLKGITKGCKIVDITEHEDKLKKMIKKLI